MGPRTRNFAKRLRRRHGEDERGAELLEFALVVVLLITLLYGIITYGVILAAQATVTQAAADAARAGIVQGTSTQTCNGSLGVSAAGCTAVQQAATDLGWMNKNGCTETVITTSPASTTNVTPSANSGSPIACTATVEPCPSAAANTCLSVAVSYNYASAPLFPEMPGLSVISPSTISSTDVLQLSTPSGQ